MTYYTYIIHTFAISYQTTSMMEGILGKPVSFIAECLKTSLDASNSPTPFEKMCHNLMHTYMTEQEKEEIYREFSMPQTYQERIAKIYPYTKKIKFTPSSAATEKCEEKANLVRETGNKYFKYKMYHEALVCYTQSIALAPTKCDSNPLAMAYGNRSAVLKVLGLLDQCIADIERAFEHDYPEHLHYKLALRQGQCLLQIGLQAKANISLSHAKDLINKANISENLKQELQNQIAIALKSTAGIKQKSSCQTILSPPPPNLSHGINKEIPTMSDCVELKYNHSRGRHLLATKDIKPGDVIAVEPPFSAILMPEHRFTHCANCLKRSHSLLPCPNCSWALFCSNICRESAWDKYHKMECKAMRCIEDLHLRTYEPAHLAVRTIALTGLEEALQFHRKSSANPIKTNNFKEQRTRGFNSAGQFISSEFSVIYHQCADVKYATSFLIGRVLLAVCLLKALQLDKLPHAIEIGGLILQLMCGHAINCHEVYEGYTSFDSNTVKDVAVGNAVYPALGLINHSCDQNVVRHYHGKTTVLRAIRTIKQGEEIVDTYGPHFIAEERVIRQQMLKIHHFDCACEACTKDWKTQEKLPWTLPMSYDQRVLIERESAKKANEAIARYMKNRTIVYDDVPKLCQHLALLDKLHHRLTQEYFVLQEIVKVSYATKGNTYVCHD